MALKEVEIFLDPEDLARVKEEFTVHLKAFGDTPAPHLQETANANMDRIMANVITCLQYRGKVDL